MRWRQRWGANGGPLAADFGCLKRGVVPAIEAQDRINNPRVQKLPQTPAVGVHDGDFGNRLRCEWLEAIQTRPSWRERLRGHAAVDFAILQGPYGH